MDASLDPGTCLTAARCAGVFGSMARLPYCVPAPQISSVNRARNSDNVPKESHVRHGTARKLGLNDRHTSLVPVEDGHIPSNTMVRFASDRRSLGPAAQRHIAHRYGTACAAVAVALATRAVFSPILGDEAPFLFFVPAILAAAGFGGLGPGLLASVLSLLVGQFFLSDFPRLQQSELVDAAIFLAIAAGLTFWGAQLV